MRDVKLRAWDKEKEEWSGADYWYEGVGLNFNVTPPSALTMSGKETHVLMQYTGLKDINGVEIYEGDVIQRTYLFSGGYGEKHTGYVFYKKEEASYVIRKENEFIGPKDEKLRTVLSDKNSYEVIGNIYENPELLEVD